MDFRGCNSNLLRESLSTVIHFTRDSSSNRSSIADELSMCAKI